MMSENNVKLSPSHLREMILDTLKEPVVFRGLLQWDILSWSLKDWTDKLGSKIMPFRSGVKAATETPQWERTCQMKHLTMKQFIELGEDVSGAGSSQGTCSDTWLYFDYKHIQEWFTDDAEIFKDVCWDTLGFPERDGSVSSLWIGSDGAHTPCHMDTYGCNLVAQVYGTKQWILFPPDQLSWMRPTRVPYEESSIYSKHNFYCPDENACKAFNGARVITLHPGEVLFVPYHWWHYVENVGTAISINTWLELPCDDEGRLKESLVLLLVSQLSKEVPDPESLLNPNEDDILKNPLSHCVALVENCVEKYQKYKQEFKQVEEPKPRIFTLDDNVLKHSHRPCVLLVEESQRHKPDFKQMESTTRKFSLGVSNSVSESSAPDEPKPKRCKTESEKECTPLKRKVMGADFENCSDVISPIPLYSALELDKLLTAKRERFQYVNVEAKSTVSRTNMVIEGILNIICHPEFISIITNHVCKKLQVITGDIPE